MLGVGFGLGYKELGFKVLGCKGSRGYNCLRVKGLRVKG